MSGKPHQRTKSPSSGSAAHIGVRPSPGCDQRSHAALGESAAHRSHVRRFGLKECSSSKATPSLKVFTSSSRNLPKRERSMKVDPCFYSFPVRFLLERIRTLERSGTCSEAKSPERIGGDSSEVEGAEVQRREYETNTQE